MTLQEIKDAVNQGKLVYWKQANYPIVKDKHDQWFIDCTNGSATGLTWQDGTTMNGKEEDFYIGPHPILELEIGNETEWKFGLITRDVVRISDDQFEIHDMSGPWVVAIVDRKTMNDLLAGKESLLNLDWV
jgi:hypothetical protein